MYAPVHAPVYAPVFAPVYANVLPAYRHRAAKRWSPAKIVAAVLTGGLSILFVGLRTRAA